MLHSPVSPKTPIKSAVCRVMLKSKIHRATLTGKALDYEGSIALDLRLMEAADLLAGEQVHVLNFWKRHSEPNLARSMRMST